MADPLTFVAESRYNHASRMMDVLSRQSDVLQVQGKRLLERQEQYTETEGELEHQRRNARNISTAQTVLSSCAAAVGVGAALASGVGEATAAALVAAAALQVGHNLASNFGWYASLSKQLGGTYKEIEERASSIRWGMGIAAFAASIATLSGCGTSAWSEGYKWATEGLTQNLNPVLALMQGGMTILSNRCNTNKLRQDLAHRILQKDMESTRMDARAMQEATMLTMREVEALFSQGLHAMKIQDKLNEAMMRGEAA